MIFSLIYKISRFEWLGFFLNEFFGGNPKWYTKYLFFLQVFISYFLFSTYRVSQMIGD